MTSNRFERAARGHCTIVRSTLGLALVTMACLALSACGASKPAYCSDRATLEDSIKGLTSLDTSSGLSGVKSQLGKIQTAATSLVDSAKGDFPAETTAIKSSLDTLATTVKGVPSDPSASQVGTVAKQTSTFVSSVQSFTSATSSKCS